MIKRTGLALLLMLAAIGAEAQNGEKVTLNILSYDGYTPEQTNREFAVLVKKEFNVDLTINVTAISNEKQLFDLVRTGKADVFTPGMDLIYDERFDYIGKKLVAPLNLEHIPNYKNLLPANYRPAYLTHGDSVYGTPIAGGGYWIAYRKSRFRTPPDSYAVFWQPENRGRYIIGDYSAHQAYLVALALNIPGDDIFNFKKLFSDTVFRDKYEYLHQNQKRNWNATDKASDFKDADLGLAYGFGIRDLWKSDKDWYMAMPKEGQLRWVDNIMINAAAAADPLKLRVAEAFVNFVLSAAYQRKVMFEGAGCEPVVRRALDDVDWSKFPGLIHLKGSFGGTRIEYIRPLTQRDRNCFDQEYRNALEMKPLFVP